MDADWESLLSLLPGDVDQVAKETGALVRKREIRDGQTLLRLLLVYSLCGFSFRQTAAWAGEYGIAKTSDVNLIERFERCGPFLQALLGNVLAERLEPVESGTPICLIDATTVTSGNGENWRIHLGYDTQGLNQVNIRDVHQAETTTLFRIQAGMLYILDRAYGKRKEIAHIVQHQGQVLCRIKWNALALVDVQGNRLNLLQTVQGCHQVDIPVTVLADPAQKIPAIEGRVLIARKPPEMLEKSKQKVKRKAQKNQSTLRPDTLEASEYLFLFTTDRSLSTEQVIALYRFRWQVELVFKRWKTIQGLDTMTVKNPALCRVFLLSHLLVALLIEKLMALTGHVFPPQALREAIALAALPVHLSQHFSGLIQAQPSQTPPRPQSFQMV